MSADMDNWPDYKDVLKELAQVIFWFLACLLMLVLIYYI